MLHGRLLASLLLSWPLAASSKPAQDATFESEASIVRLDVVVKDAAGRPLRDLRREDFEVREDGVLQRIVHFQRLSSNHVPVAPAGAPPESSPSAASASDAEAPPPRHLVFAVDDLHLGTSSLLVARREVAALVDGALEGADEVALVTTSGSFGTRQRFTRDKSAIRGALERMGFKDRSARSRFDRPFISETQAEQIEGKVLPNGGRTSNEAFELAVEQFMGEFRITRDVAESMVMERVRAILDEGRRATLDVCDTLEKMIRDLGELPGRKVVVLLSEGFYLGRGTLYETSYDLRRLTDAATRSGVVVYSIDVSGAAAPQPGGDPSERSLGNFALRQSVETFSTASRREGMKRVADDTGGLALFDMNDVGRALERVLTDGDDYYLLAYEPANPAHDGHFRKVEVRIRGERGKIEVRTRAGYFAPRGPGRPPTATEARAAAEDQMRAALQSVVALRGLPIETQAAFVDLPDLGTAAIVETRVGTRTVVAAADQPPPRLELAFAITDEAGAIAWQGIEELQLSASGASRGEIEHRKPFKLAPGRYDVAVVARAGSGKMGSAHTTVQIPDTSQGLTLSDVFLSSAADHSSGPRFRQGTDLDFVVFAYDAPGDLLVTAALRSGVEPGEAFRVKPTPADTPDPRRVAYGGRLSLTGLAPGEYELRVSASHRQTGSAAAQAARFIVVPAPSASTPPPAVPATSPVEPADPALAAVLERAGEYAVDYEQAFRDIVAEEYCTQTFARSLEAFGAGVAGAGAFGEGAVPQATGSQGILTRRTRADLVFARLPGTLSWGSFRDVFEVDGVKVRDRDARLEKLFRDEPGSAAERAGAIVQENARYNIGTARRNINIPTLPLLFLDPRNRPRFSFEQAGRHRVAGVDAVEIRFAENARPTLIKDSGSGADLPAEGSFWIDPGRGTVLRTVTRFRFGPDRGSGEITTEYRREPALRMWVPSEMAEKYEDRGAASAGLGSSTSSVARCSNFRQFSVTIEDEAATLPKAPEAAPPR